MNDLSHDKCILETLQDLREDASLLHLCILGLQGSVDELTRVCLLRLTDYLNQHVNDICVLCGK